MISKTITSIDWPIGGYSAGTLPAKCLLMNLELVKSGKIVLNREVLYDAIEGLHKQGNIGRTKCLQPKTSQAVRRKIVCFISSQI